MEPKWQTTSSPPPRPIEVRYILNIPQNIYLVYSKEVAIVATRSAVAPLYCDQQCPACKSSQSDDIILDVLVAKLRTRVLDIVKYSPYAAISCARGIRVACEGASDMEKCIGDAAPSRFLKPPSRFKLFSVVSVL